MNSKDIAKIVGVSRSTVSRVINNYPDIPQATREKVLKAIKEYNYYPNASARRLAGMKSSTLGIFIIDIRDNEKPHHVIENNEDLLYGNSYFSSFINAFIDQSNKAQYHVLVSTIYSSKELWKIQSAFYEKRIDGAVIIGSSKSDYNKIFEITDKDFVTVAVDLDMERENTGTVMSVNINNYDGVSDAIDYLIELGHRDIAVITGDLNKLSGKIRLESFKDALLRHGLPLNDAFIAYGDFTEHSGYEGMKKILASERKPTAVFVSNDTMAIGAYRAIEEQGFKIPEDISVMGFDNSYISQYMSPPLTTVNVSLPEIAKCSIELLLDSINNKEIKNRQKTVNVQIIKRNSCRKIV
ncbi:LacI family DNA-binding transcriptional regulator [Acetivibrio straminisolvens]|jgi:LacI family transcriptional regulator|uniref:Maltose operon transcriptional repressor n=1 Tax=Acetivibrio straminisolvens JCM 21531 TaxID=1294263 RepID=W4V1N7_9FIRM|nr:LacI family DNA-binding transcriptional regulator [Acetivibrio straminisolvens]GAE87007.1 maltose operon transcriptional repressor [Acetivibrio straminisolvens JCM 21531]